jgi:hypothetical protein
MQQVGGSRLSKASRHEWEDLCKGEDEIWGGLGHGVLFSVFSPLFFLSALHGCDEIQRGLGAPVPLVR